MKLYCVAAYTESIRIQDHSKSSRNTLLIPSLLLSIYDEVPEAPREISSMKSTPFRALDVGMARRLVDRIGL